METFFEQVSEYLKDRSDVEKYLEARLRDSDYNTSSDFSTVHATVTLIEDIYDVAEHLEGGTETDLVSFQSIDAPTQKYLDAGLFDREGSKLHANPEYMRALLMVRKNVELAEGEEREPEELDLEALVENPESMNFEQERNERGETVFSDGGDEYELDEEDMESGGGPEWF